MNPEENNTMKHEGSHHGPHPMPGHHKFATWNSWSSWSSPVGLGIFMFLGALGVAIALYALLNLIGAFASLAHPAMSQSMSAQDMQQLEQQYGAQGAGAMTGTGAGTSAMPTTGTGAMQ